MAAEMADSIAGLALVAVIEIEAEFDAFDFVSVWAGFETAELAGSISDLMSTRINLQNQGKNPTDNTSLFKHEMKMEFYC